LVEDGEVSREEFSRGEMGTHMSDAATLTNGARQTSTQTSVVAVPVQALQLRGHERVLEIGTGSGYAAAILGSLAREVETVERIEEPAFAPPERLAPPGHTTRHVPPREGALGWPARPPHAAAPRAPRAPTPPP